jgi:hypothetical protein
MTGRFLTLLGSALFVFYCTAVGVYLLLHPWFPGPRGAGFPASGYFRGFVSGLGLVHIFAGIADVRALARSFDAATAPRPSTGEPGPGAPVPGESSDERAARASELP